MLSTSKSYPGKHVQIQNRLPRTIRRGKPQSPQWKDELKKSRSHEQDGTSWMLSPNYANRSWLSHCLVIIPDRLVSSPEADFHDSQRLDRSPPIQIQGPEFLQFHEAHESDCPKRIGIACSKIES